jgi:hypothetical protein
LTVGYVLLWLEAIAVALLSLALAVGWASRGRLFLRSVVPAVVFLVFAGMAAFAANATAPWQREWGKYLPADLFVYFLGWLLVYLASGVLLLWWVFRRPAPGLARRGGVWSAKKLGLALGGAALALALTFWNLDLAARADLAAARQEAGDLLQTMLPPPVADSENAARLYAEAGKDLGAPVRNPWHDAARQGMAAHPHEEPSWKEPYVVELVARQEKVLALLRKAAAMPPCNLDRRRSLDELFYDADLGQLRWEEITLLAVDARVKAAHGDRARAFADAAAILGASRHVQTFFSAPEVLGTQTTAWRTVEDVLPLGQAASGSLPPPAFPEVVSPIRVLRREMAVMGMIWPALMSDDPLRIPELKKDSGPWSKPPLVGVTETLVIPGCRIFLTPSELAYTHKEWEAYRGTLRAPAEGTPQDWAALRGMVHTEPSGIFTAVFIKPKEEVLLRGAGELAALEQLTRAGLAAARYRDKHGRYPEHLEQLVPDFLPAMPVDPRDGQALQLKRFPDLTVLYTLESDGGLAKATQWNAEEYRNRPVFRLFHREQALPAKNAPGTP